MRRRERKKGRRYAWGDAEGIVMRHGGNEMGPRRSGGLAPLFSVGGGEFLAGGIHWLSPQEGDPWRGSGPLFFFFR